MDDCAKTSLALDDGIRHAHFSAERRQEDDKLDGVNIIRDEHEGRLLGLDECDNVVQPVLDHIRLLADILLLLAIGHRCRLGMQTLLLVRLSLRSVLVEKLEHLRSRVAVECVLELGECGRDLEAHVEDLALALEAYVRWPVHHAREVALRLDVLPDAEVAWAAFDEGVLMYIISMFN